MTRSPRLALLLAVPLLVLAGCASDSDGAAVACEQLIDRRVGATLEHDGPMQGATVEGTGPFVVRSAFVEPATGRKTRYVCTVEQAQVDGGDGWRLLDLQTSR